MSQPLDHQRFEGRRAGLRHRRRAAATLAALAVHGLFGLALLRSTSGTTLAGADGAGEGDIDVVLVSLAGLRGGPTAASAPATAAPDQPADLQSMFDRLRIDASDLRQPERADSRPGAADLLDDIDRRRAEARARNAPQEKPGDGGAADAKGPGQARHEQGDANAAHNARDGAAGLPSRALFAQVERCWKRLPGSASVPVSLEITLDDRGRLAAPPVILRAETAPLNEKRLSAEARILQALAACAPYRPSPPGQRRTYRLEFKPSN